METDHPRDGRVARVCAPDVAARRRLVAGRIVGKDEVVVATWVGAELGIVVQRADRQGSTAPPPPHHLRCEELLLFWTARAFLQVPPELPDALVELAKGDVGSV